MQAGRLRHRVNIQVRSETTNAIGEKLDVWSDSGTARWAEIEPVEGGAAIEGEQAIAEVTHLVHLRWSLDLDLTPQKRIRFRDRIFDIVAVRNVREANREIVADCVERV